MDHPAALATLRAAYARAPRRVRLHVLGRFATCPFLPVLARLPGGSLLDVGAGHGALALLAVRSGAADSAIALEPDLRKVLAVGGPLSTPGGAAPTTLPADPPGAVRPLRDAPRGPRLAFVAGTLAAVGSGFAAVSIVDVLYRLPLASWDAYLAAARDRLALGGALLLKWIDPSYRLKGAWNRVQERVADLLHLTQGDAFSYEPPAAMVARLQRLGLEDIEVVDLGRGYLHAHVLYVARRRA